MALIRPHSSGGVTTLPDPGDTGTIETSANNAFLPIESGGAETRTLNAPVREAQQLTVYDRVHGGTVTITATETVDGSDNEIQLAAARAMVRLIGILHLGTLKWQVAWTRGAVVLGGA